MATATSLPTEIWSNILSYAEPEDLLSCNLACSFLYQTIKDNIAMYRALYLNYLVSKAPVDRVVDPSNSLNVCIDSRINRLRQTWTGSRRLGIWSG